MGRAAGNAGSRTIVAVKAAATNGSKDARRLRALCTPSFFSLSRAKRHETGAHADSDCLARLMSGLRLCTLRCGGRAHVLPHYRRRHARELQRCTRVDLTHVTAIVRSWTPWCGRVELVSVGPDSSLFTHYGLVFVKGVSGKVPTFRTLGAFMTPYRLAMRSPLHQS